MVKILRQTPSVHPMLLLKLQYGGRNLHQLSYVYITRYGMIIMMLLQKNQEEAKAIA
jgi:hypothetical protein